MDIFEEKKSIPYVTIGLIVVNVLVFLIMEFFGSTEDVSFMYEWGAQSTEKVIYCKEYYRLITSFFIHFGTGHLTNNMVVLAILGYHLEYDLGRIKFTVVYFLSGVLSGAASLLWNYWLDNNVVCAGASGAVFGLLGTFIYLLYSQRHAMEYFPYVRVVLFLVITLYAGLSDPGVDNVAHFAGFVAGIMIMMIFSLLRREKRYEDY